MEAIGTGFASIDEALGGLITGDNVVWQCYAPDLYASLAAGFVTSAGAGSCLAVSFGEPRLPVAAGEWLDAGPRSPLARPVALADELERRVARDAPACLVIDRLDRVVKRWGPDAAGAFFARICPAMLLAGVTAYWGVGDALGRPFIDRVRQITQCLLDVRGGRLLVVKAEGRPDALQGISYQLHLEGDAVSVTSTAAGGRLARGLIALRRELGLSQIELARIAEVTPSAISQAESGRRGLSVDTLVAMADRLDVSVDRILGVASTRTYRLARHDRARRMNPAGIVALATDVTVGMRSYLIELAPGETVEPPFDHRGVAWVGVLRGLVQVDLGDDRPVMRPGDSLLIEHAGVRSWRNLRREPAEAYWLVRD